MTTYFKKLDTLNLPYPKSINDIKGKLLHHYGFIRYFEISDLNYIESFKDFFKISPSRILLVECYSWLNPHRDNGQQSCLNFYLNSENFETKFWSPKENAVKMNSIKYDGFGGAHTEVESSGGKYNRNDLIFVDSFQANDGDSYFLNVEEIHSIERSKENSSSKKIRTMIQLQWHLSMNEMMEKLDL